MEDEARLMFGDFVFCKLELHTRRLQLLVRNGKQKAFLLSVEYPERRWVGKGKDYSPDIR